MNDFLFAHKKTYTDFEGKKLTLLFDVDLKNNILSDLQFKGTLFFKYEKEIKNLISTFLNKRLDSLSGIKALNSLPLQLLYSSLDEYQGHIPIQQGNIVCLCFGINKQEVDAGTPTMAGRACGSCRPFLQKKVYKKIAGLYPGPLVVKLDEFKEEWARENNVEISIEAIEENRLEVKMKPYDKEKLQSLSDYFFLKLNTRFFLRATL